MNVDKLLNKAKNLNRTSIYDILNNKYPIHILLKEAIDGLSLSSYKNSANIFNLQDCKFLYEDIDKNILDNWVPMSYQEIRKFNEFNIIPYNVYYIGVYDNTCTKKYLDINIKKIKTKFKTRLYRVGLMSDMHYNDTSVDIDPYTVQNVDGSEYDGDLDNALEFYENKENVQFMCGAGDVSTDSKEHLRNFALKLKTLSPTTPLYTCLGNHDFQATHYEVSTLHGPAGFGLTEEYLTRVGIWNEHITPKDNTIHFFDESTEDGKLSYYIERYIPNTSKYDIFVFLSVDYGVTHNTRTTRSSQDIKGAQKMLDYNDEDVKKIMDYLHYKDRTNIQKQYDYQFYNSKVLIWLHDLIKKNLNKRIFLFTHQFFSQKAGNNNSNQYYSYADDYWRISQRDDSNGQIGYCLCGLQFDFLNTLNNNYQNVIWFTGHSHYSWKWQLINKTINICNKDYKIMSPNDNEFIKDYRYLRKKITKSYSAPSEYYTSNTTYIGTMISTQIPLENGRYKIKLIGTAAFTPGRNLTSYTTDGNMEVAYIKVNEEKKYIPINFTTDYTFDEYKDKLKEFTINVIDGRLNIQINTENKGANWFTLNIIEIKNLDTNKKISLDNIKIKERHNNIANKADYKYVKYCKIDHCNNSICISAYNVHLPSLARPIPYHVDSYGVSLKSSEGAIMDIYEDYIDIRGIIFKDESIDQDNYINKYYPLAQYRIYLKSR